jgi:hypothetical protein
MKAAFGLRFLPAFFAFFFAISVSPLNVLCKNWMKGLYLGLETRSGFSPAIGSGDVKMPNKLSRVNAFQREIATLSPRQSGFSHAGT